MITFSVLSGSIVEEYGGFLHPLMRDDEPIPAPRQKRRLHLHVRCNEDERITLSNGVHLRDVKGTVCLYPQVDDIASDTMGIGNMSYYKEVPEFRVPPQYFVEALLPPNQFEALVQAACFGNLPSSISVNQRGMSHPNEFCTKWDETKVPHPPIASIDISVPIRQPAEEPKASEFEIALLNATKTITERMKWIVGLIAVSLAIALVR